MYLNEYVDNSVIYNDILDILSDRSELAYSDFNKTTELEYMIQSKKY